LYKPLLDFPFSLAMSTSPAEGLPGRRGSESVFNAFVSSLKASTLLRHTSTPATAVAAANAQLPLERVRGLFEECVHGAAASAVPAAAAAGGGAPTLVPLRILLRAPAEGSEAVVVIQEGVKKNTSLLGAVVGALQRAGGYMAEARSVILTEEGGAGGGSSSAGTHTAILAGAQIHTVGGLWGAPVEEVEAAARLPDGWLYISLCRSAGYGSLGM